MPKIESCKSYWNEFSEKDLDSKEFKSLVAEDPVLLKIYKFAFEPWSISENIHQYPFDTKIDELKTISEKEEDFLFNKRLYLEGDVREWFDFFCKRYLLVKHTIRIRSKLNDINKQFAQKVSEKKINEVVRWAFDNHLSQDSTTIYKKAGGVQRIERTTGIYFPVRILKDCLIIKEEKVFNEKTGEYEKTKIKSHIRRECYLRKPTEEDIETAFKELDVFSAISFQKHGQIMPNITYGSHHPGLDRSLYAESIIGHTRPEHERFLIEFYYIDPSEKNKCKKFKPLAYHGRDGKEYTRFVFPIRKRYLPLMKEVTGQIIKKYYEEKLGNREDLLREAEGKLFEMILKYDESIGVAPAGFLVGKWGFEHFESEVFKRQSTTVIPEFSKAKRILRTDVEHSGGSLDDIVEVENEEGEGEEVRRVELDLFGGTPFDVETFLMDLSRQKILSQLSQNERKLYDDYYIKGLTQEKLIPKHGKSQSTISRNLEKLEEKLKKLI